MDFEEYVRIAKTEYEKNMRNGNVDDVFNDDEAKSFLEKWYEIAKKEFENGKITLDEFKLDAKNTGYNLWMYL